MILTFVEFLKAAEHNGLTVGMVPHVTRPMITVRTKRAVVQVAPVWLDADAVDWTATLRRVVDAAWPVHLRNREST